VVFLETQFRKVDLSFADAVRQLDAGNATAALLNRLKPSMTFALELTLRSCCSITLFKYFEDGTFWVPGQQAPGLHLTDEVWSFFRQIEEFSLCLVKSPRTVSLVCNISRRMPNQGNIPNEISRRISPGR